MKQVKEKRIIQSMVFSARRSFFPSAAFAAFCLCLRCGLYNTDDVEPLTMRCITALSDTLSVYPRLSFVFSNPLSDSSVAVSFSPPTSAMFGALLSATHDTLTVQVMEALEGDTRYVVRLGAPVTSINGGVLVPSDDSTVFFTFPCEQEPNDTKDNADTFTSCIFGKISDVSDIDAFICAAAHPRAVYMQSIDCQDSFFIEDTASRVLAMQRQMRPTDTLWLPDSMQVAFVFVRSSLKGSAGEYQLGVILR